MLAIIITLIFSILIFPFIYKLAIQYNYVDKNVLDSSNSKIPIIGGPLIFIPLFFLIFFLDLDSNYKYLILSCSVLLVIGIIDDYLKLGIAIRLISQFITAILLVSNGFLIQSFYLDSLLIDFKQYSYLFTVLFILTYVNSYNFIDGSDGICSSLSLVFFTMLLFFFNGFSSDEKYIFIYIILIILFFTIFNLGLFSKFKIYLGDSGSTCIGLLISFYVIKYGFYNTGINFKPLFLIWLTFVPLMDTFSVILLRIRKLKSPFIGDKNHLHHILRKMKLSSKSIFIIITLFSIFFAFLGYFLTLYFNDTVNIFVMIILFSIYHYSFYRIIQK